MKYLESYNSYLVNEEASFRNALLTLVIAATVGNVSYKIFNKFFKKKDVISLYHDIKEQDAQPNPQTSKLFNNLRKDIISKIEKSNRIDDEHKQKIIDSLKTIPFYIIESDRYELLEGTYASFVHMPIKRLTKETKDIIGDGFKQNMIVINSDHIDDVDKLSQTITHEIYHYVDNLMGSDDEHWSEMNNVSSLVDDKCLIDKSYLRNKVKFVLLGTEEISYKGWSILDRKVDHFWKYREYYTSPSEIFVRFQNMKRWLIEEGQLKSMNDKIEEKHISYILKKDVYDLWVNEENDFVSILIFLSFNDIDGYNKIISQAGGSSPLKVG